jgi:hypothetical protein
MIKKELSWFYQWLSTFSVGKYSLTKELNSLDFSDSK